MIEILVFLVSLTVPSLAFRVVAHRSHPDTRAPQQQVHVPRVHHAHYGIVIVFVASQLFLFSTNKSIIAFFFGLGLGLLVDEFIPSIRMTQFEPDNTKVYLTSFKQTLILFLLASALTLSFYIMTLWI